MKCPKCGYILPQDSEFCQYCGEKLAILPEINSNSKAPEGSSEISEDQICNSAVVEKSAQEEGNVSSIHGEKESSCPDEKLLTEKKALNVLQDNSARENGPPVSNKKKKFCKLCGGLIDPKTKRCTSCGQQHFGFSKNVFFVAIFTVILLALAGLNIFQYISYNRANSIIDDLEKQAKTNDAKIAALENKAAYYDDICDFLNNGNIGYAADNFNTDKSVILVKKSDTSMKVTLTAYWGDGGTVSASSSSSSADVVFDDDSWDETTTLTVEPHTEGVSIITFSNDVDSDTFNILIIVTE